MWVCVLSVLSPLVANSKTQCQLSIAFENQVRDPAAPPVALSVDFGRSRVEHPLIRPQPMAEKKQVWSVALSSGQRQETVESLRFNGRCDIGRRFHLRVCHRIGQGPETHCASLIPKSERPFAPGHWRLTVQYVGGEQSEQHPPIRAVLSTDERHRVAVPDTTGCPIRLLITNEAQNDSGFVVWDIGASRVSDATWSWHGLVSKKRKDPWWVSTGHVASNRPLTLIHAYTPDGTGRCQEPRRFKLRLCDVEATMTRDIECQTLTVPDVDHPTLQYQPGPWTFTIERVAAQGKSRFRVLKSESVRPDRNQ